MKTSIEHHQFKDVIDFFGPEDLMVLNNTKVFLLACLETKKNGAQELKFFLQELNEEQRLWDVLVDPAQKLELGTNFTLAKMTVW